MAYTPITPVDVSPSVPEPVGWTDIDLSAVIPAGSTGVALCVVNTSGSTAYYWGARKNGSTDNRRARQLSLSTRCGMFIGCDANRVIQVYQENAAIVYYLVGAFGSEAVFFDNGVNKSTGTTASWVDVDVSSETGAATAIAAIFDINGVSGGGQWGWRPKGSSDERLADGINYSTRGVIVGLDANEVCQQYIENASQDCYLVGYLTSGYTKVDPATDLSLGSTGAYADLTALPAGAIAGVIEINSADNTGGYDYSLREKGGSFDQYCNLYSHNWEIVECDANRVIEGKISNTNCDFWLTGYFTGAATPRHNLMLMGVG